MAKTPQISTKRVAISKANAQVVGIVGGAAFLTIFCLFAAKAAWASNRYNAKVVTQKEQAHKQLTLNEAAFTKLKSSYASFDNQDKNVLGGSKDGAGDNDGTNSKLVLDALPSSYDFPALASSLEKVLIERNFQITSISGTDDQVNQQANLSSPTPKATDIPFSFTVGSANYVSVSQLIDTLQKSIRPIQVDSLTMNGAANNMTVTVNAHTFYQPAKSVDIKKQVVK